MTRARSLAALAMAAASLGLVACGGQAQEQEPEIVLAEDESTELDESALEVDPSETAEATAKLQLVPGGTATPVNSGIFSGGRPQQGETFGFRSDGGNSSEGIGIGGGSGLGGGTSFGSSNATSGGGEALSAAGRAVSDAGRAAASAGSDLAGSAGVGASDLVGIAGSTPTGAAAAAAAAAGSGEGKSFGFRSDGGDASQSGSFGFRSDGGGAAPPASAPRSRAVVPGSAIDTTPGAVSVPSGSGSPGIAAAGETFGQRVDQPTSRLPQSFGYAGPPRPQDQPAPTPVAAPAPGTGNPSASAGAAVPVTAPPQGGGVDTPLPPLSKTLPPVTPAATPVAGRPTPRGAKGVLFGCAPAGRPAAPPRVRMLRPGPTGLGSVAFVCLPAGVRPRFDGWRNRAGVTRITQTSDAGDVYEVPMSLARRGGVGLPRNVLVRNPELRALPERVTALRGFSATDATVSRLIRRPRATFAEITPRALARVPAADLNRVARGAWADIRVRDLRKLPATRWSQVDRRVVAAVPQARRSQLSPAARRAIAGRGL